MFNYISLNVNVLANHKPLACQPPVAYQQVLLLALRHSNLTNGLKGAICKNCPLVKLILKTNREEYTTRVHILTHWWRSPGKRRDPETRGCRMSVRETEQHVEAKHTVPDCFFGFTISLVKPNDSFKMASHASDALSFLLQLQSLHFEHHFTTFHFTLLWLPVSFECDRQFNRLAWESIGTRLHSHICAVQSSDTSWTHAHRGIHTYARARTHTHKKEKEQWNALTTRTTRACIRCHLDSSYSTLRGHPDHNLSFSGKGESVNNLEIISQLNNLRSFLACCFLWL